MRWSPGAFAATGVSQVLLVSWAVLVIFPLVWMVMTAFKSDQEIL